MSTQSSQPTIPLPKHWNDHVRAAMLHVISLAQLACAYTRGWAANSTNARVCLTAAADRSQQQTAVLAERMRIKDARMARLAPHQRPHYTPAERMAILEIRAAQGWSLEQTAREFLVTAATVSSWMKRIDEDGPDALVEVPVPVNRFPDFVRYAVQRLKALCPSLGKVKIAKILGRAGLHIGPTTVGRIVKEEPFQPAPTGDLPGGADAASQPSTVEPAPPQASPHCPTSQSPRVVTAKYPDHV